MHMPQTHWQMQKQKQKKTVAIYTPIDWMSVDVHKSVHKRITVIATGWLRCRIF